MKARRNIGESAYRLFEGDREIGFIRGGTVGFTGFVTAEEAALDPEPALGSSHPHRPGGTRGRGGPGGDSPPPPGQQDEGGWTVELELMPGERFEVLTIARARAMWTSLLGFGIAGRMRQFTEMSPVPA